MEEFNRRDPTEPTLENLPLITTRLKLSEVECGGRRAKEGGIENGRKFERDSKWVFVSVVPTTSTVVVGSGNGSIMLTPKRGLSDMNSPTWGWWRTTGRLREER